MSGLANRPSYNFAPIQEGETLAEVLGLAVPQLRSLANNAHKMYRLKTLIKNGSARETWDAHRQLKDVQEIIKIRILRNVAFPLYLQGCIWDKQNPRDYGHNAAFHTQKKCLVTFDIEKFFPSVTSEMVNGIWQRFFRFPPDVADLMTKLTTKDGFLPQGAKPSSYLANLVFWKNEHELVAHLQQLSWQYSRLVDDVTISTNRVPSPEELTQVNKRVIGFFQHHGFRLKRAKHKIYRQNVPMKVNNLIVNEHPALPKSSRKKIRAQFNELTNQQLTGVSPEEKFVASTNGKVAMLRRFHKANADSILGKPEQSS